MKTAIALLFCFIHLSCLGGGVDDVVVSSKPFLLSQVTTEFRCDPPLVRTHRSASLWIDIVRPWKPEPPWDHIVVEEVGNVIVGAVLVGSSGAQFTPAVLGSAGGALDLRFDPEIPNNEKIVLIRLTSSEPLDVRRVIWHNFDPI